MKSLEPCLEKPELLSPPLVIGPPLTPEFFLQKTVSVARALLGKGLYLHRADIGQTLLVEIVEVEAYLGTEDPASHAYRGLTRRNGAMCAPLSPSRD
jgi:DNA-3-methyladenine glycosylase